MKHDMNHAERDADWTAMEVCIPLVREGNEDAARQFASRLGPLARTFFRERGLPAADAEDLAVTSITEIVFKLGQFETGNFTGWVFQILRHLLADQFRRRPPLIPLEERDLEVPMVEPGGNGVLDEAGHAALHEHLAALSEPERLVLLLRHGREALPFEELGHELGVKPGAARVRYFRTREKLETRLRQDPRMKAALSRSLPSQP